MRESSSVADSCWRAHALRHAPPSFSSASSSGGSMLSRAARWRQTPRQVATRARGQGNQRTGGGHICNSRSAHNSRRDASPARRQPCPRAFILPAYTSSLHTTVTALALPPEASLSRVRMQRPLLPRVASTAPTRLLSQETSRCGEAPTDPPQSQCRTQSVLGRVAGGDVTKIEMLESRQRTAIESGDEGGAPGVGDLGTAE